MPLPVPTLDHVVINVHDRMDEAQALYTRLGFALTPRGYHTLGSMNHLAILGTEYLELIAVPPGDPKRSDILGWPTGLNGLVWGTEDSQGVHEALVASGVVCTPPGEFSRPVQLPTGTRDAVFRTVRLPKETTEAGRLYFCHHFTRDLVWRDEWRHHPNGAIGVRAAVIAARDPGRLASLFRRMFGDAAIAPIPNGHCLRVGLTNFEIVTPAELATRYDTTAPQGETRDEYMAALVLRSRSMDETIKHLRDFKNTRLDLDRRANPGARLIVPASETMGVTLDFRE